jgi:hypothetical protein
MTSRSQDHQSKGRAPGYGAPPIRRLISAVAAIAAHLLMLLLVYQAWPRAQSLTEPMAVRVSLVEPPPPPSPEPAERPLPARPAREAARSPSPRLAPAEPAPAHREVRPVTPPPETLPASEVQAVELGDAELAGAITAGPGRGEGGRGDGPGGGRACDMVRRLQDALRRDRRVQAAVAEVRRAPGAGGGAIMLWNGDWIRSPGEDGKGLAGVRQAIITEVAFAPEACRAEPMRRLVVLSLDDGPGSARLVLGSRLWRWSDLLFAR